MADLGLGAGTHGFIVYSTSVREGRQGLWTPGIFLSGRNGKVESSEQPTNRPQELIWEMSDNERKMAHDGRGPSSYGKSRPEQSMGAWRSFMEWAGLSWIGRARMKQEESYGSESSPPAKSHAKGKRTIDIDKVASLTKTAMFAYPAIDDDVDRALARQMVEKAEKALVDILVAPEDNEDALCQLARTNQVWEVVRAAVTKMSDQRLLREIVTAGRESHDGRAGLAAQTAVGRLVDQQFLRELVYDEKTDPSVRRAAARAISDSRIVHGIATDAKLGGWLRANVFERLCDESACEKLIIADQSCEVRAACARKIRNQPILAQVASSDPESVVRAAATNELSDQAVLGRIAAKDPDPAIRAIAVARLTDEDELIKVAVGCCGSIAMAAFNKLATENTRAEVAIGGKGEVALLAASWIREQEHLALVATRGTEPEVRRTAIGKLTDANALATVMRSEVCERNRLLALEKVTDPHVISEAAARDASNQVRKLAVTKLVDEVLVGRIALEDSDPWVREAALGRTINDRVLVKAALTDRSVEPRIAAVKRLSDEADLKRIACEAELSEVQAAALERIRDEVFLGRFVLERLHAPKPDAFDTEGRERERTTVDVIKRLRDQAILKRIAQEADYRYCDDAVRRISDDDFLFAIAMEKYSEAAACNIRDQSLLEQLALCANAKRWVRAAAIKRLKNTNVLKQLAAADADNDIRITASNALREAGS